MKKGLLQLVSKYRTELMGYAILGVFICHVVMRTQLHSTILHEIPRLVYTQGFLFLSGFGLYYSFSNDGNLTRYFTKRIRRLYIPYFMMSLPFFLIIVWASHQTILDLLGYLTTLVFWVKGNFYGMWYIAVTIALYIAFPLMYKWMFYKQGGAIFRSAILLFGMFVAIYCLNKYCPDYYALIGKWIDKTLMFPMGMLCGYMCKTGISLKRKYVIIMMIVLTILYMVTIVNPIFIKKEYLRCLCGVFSLSLLFSVLEKSHYSKKILTVLHWLGTYSLELYVLHVLIFKTIDACIVLSEPYKVMILSIFLALLVCKPVHNVINNFESTILDSKK